MKNNKLFTSLLILTIFTLGVLFVLLIGGGLLMFNQRAATTDKGFNEISPTHGNAATNLFSTPTPPTPQEQATLDVFESINNGEPSPYWIPMQDPNHGFRFAIPCFWNANFPNRADFSYTIQNYPPEYVNEFPRGEGVFDVGGVKLDVSIWDPVDWGQPGGLPVEQFIQNIYANDTETTLLAVDRLMINNQPTALVTTQSTFGIGQFYLFPYTGDTFLMIGASQKLIQHPDVQRIVNSIALTPDIEVHIPSEPPGNPPPGLSAPCMDVNEPVSELNQSNPNCIAHAYALLPDLNLALTTALTNHDYDTLAYSIANNPTTISYWQSEGALRTPDELFSEFSDSILPASSTTTLKFTSDREAFPALPGISPDTMYGPTLNIADIIYATGLGPDGNAEALLYLAQDTCDFFYWHGIVYARTGFGD